MDLLPVDFQDELTFTVEHRPIQPTAATTVAMPDGFVATYPVGTVTAPDFLHGRSVITATAAAAELNILSTVNASFWFDENQPIRLRAQLTPGTLPLQQNIYVGCMEDMLTGPVIAAGAGPKLDSDMFGFYTPDSSSTRFVDDNFWYCVSSFGALQQITALTADNLNNISKQAVPLAVGGVGVARDFVAEWVPTNVVPGLAGAAPTLLDAEVRFWIDGVLVAKHLQRGVNQITIGNHVLQDFGVAMMNITDIAVLNVDFLKCSQLRN